MRSQEARPWLPYAISCVAVALAIGGRLLLDPILDHHFPFATLFFAVVLSAWYGGFGPAIAASIAGAIGAVYFLLPPRATFAIEGWDQIVGLGLYLAISFGIAWLGGNLHAASLTAAKRAQEAGAASQLLEARVADRTADLERSLEALEASEERLRRLIEGLSDHAIFMLDPEGAILTWSAGAEVVTGFPAGDVVGRGYSTLFASECVSAEKPGRELARAASEGRVEISGWRVRRDGSRFWANGTLAALHDAAGGVVGFACVTRDETAKRRNDELLRSVLDNTLDGIISIDQRGIVHLFNRAAETIFGRSAAEVVGRSVNVLMPEPHSRDHDRYVGDYLRTGERKIIGIGREVEGLRGDGSTVPIELSVTEFELDRQTQFVGIVRDLSKTKLLEGQLRQAQKLETLGQLAGGIAHDFNNFLTVISGYSELLRAELPAAHPTQGMIDAVRDAGDRAAGLTRQLLVFGRGRVLEPSVVDLNETVSEIETMLRRLIGEDILLTTVLAANLSPVRVDASQIGQVIVNLAVNARDAMPDGGELRIETREVELDNSHGAEHRGAGPGRYVALVVRDTGSGMTPEVQARVFEPFFTTKGPGTGTGLGLAVVHGIVRQSGGSIEVKSTAGAGTAFEIYLPAARGPVRRTSQTAASVAVGGNETILLVEDEDAVRKVIALALKNLGYLVLQASSGDAALEAVARHGSAIDLVVSDVIMPGMSGPRLAEILQARQPGLRFLLLSGYADDAIVGRGSLPAEVGFLQKPFTPTALTRKIRELLEGA